MACMKVICFKDEDEGKAGGQQAILAELKKIQLNENESFIRPDIQTADSKAADAMAKLKNALMSGSRLSIIGGDHSNTYDCVNALSEVSGNNGQVGLLIFDAHPDCRPNYKGQKDWLRKLIDEKIIEPQNVVIAGIRNVLTEEHGYLVQHKVRVFPMKNLAADGIDDFCDTLMENVRQWKSAYISIDMDAIDPAFAPEVEAPEPGGFSAREILSIVQRLRNLRNIKVVDVCEVLGQKDSENITARLAAKLMSEFY